MKARLFLLYLIFIGAVNIFAADAVFEARMISPKYRNAIYATMGKVNTIKFRITSSLTDTELASCNALVTLSGHGVSKVWTFNNLYKYAILECDVSSIDFQNTRSSSYGSDDPYKFKIDLKQGASVKGSVTLDLHKYPPAPSGVKEVRFDDGNNLLINGTPALLVGPYAYTNLNASLFESEGFNMVHTNQTVGSLWWSNSGVAWVLNSWDGNTPMDSTEDYGNTSAAISKIQSTRTNSQLVANYLCDEPGSYQGKRASWLRDAQDKLQPQDPYHPLWWCDLLYGGVSPDKKLFMKRFEGYYDLIVTDSYPCLCIGGTHLRKITWNNQRLHDYKDGGCTFNMIDVPAGGVVQTSADQDFSLRFPKKNELYNMVFQHLACASKFLTVFSWEKRADEGGVQAYSYWQDINSDLKESEVKSAILSNPVAGTVFPKYLFPNNGEIKVWADGTGAWSRDLATYPDSPDSSHLTWLYSRSSDDKTEYITLVNTSNEWDEGKTIYKGSGYRVITVEVTFNLPGSQTVEVLLKDNGMPTSYTLSKSRKITVALNGVNDTYKGVLILKRAITSTTPIEPGISTWQNIGAVPINCLSAYPNPANGNTLINLSKFADNLNNASLRIYDINGKLVWKKNLKNSQHFVNWNTSNYSSGNYIIHLQTGNNVYKKNICVEQ